jgi:hypothetical protein
MTFARSLAGTVAVAAVLTLAGGCGSPGGPDRAKEGTKKEDDHAHGSGPHGGTVADWGPGGRYHVEFDVDHGKQEATVHVLGSDARTAAPIRADSLHLKIKEPPFEVELKPAPQKGDPPGKSSRFTGKHPRLGKEQEFEGTITGSVDGKTYSADFKEEPKKE